MRVRLVTLAALAGVSVAALPSHAASAPKPQITDPAGDANGVNDQGAGEPVPSESTPVDVSAADIRSVLFATTFSTRTVAGKLLRKPTGFTITMTLSAAPTLPNVIYRVAATAPACQTVFFEYSTAATGGGGSARCAKALPAPSSPIAVTSIVKGDSVIWTVPLTSLAAGQKLSGLNAQTRFISGTPGVSVTAPQYDGAASNATFTVGK